MPRPPSRTQADRAARVKAIFPILRRIYPDARCSLDYNNALELLVATILAAQCTDVRVNLVTRDLFGKYRSAADFARVPAKELEKDIQSTGFFRNKAKAITAMAGMLVEKHGGQVPDTMEALTALPGVGRKTANVILGNAFGKNEGVVVDTHVTRLANRLGLTRHRADAVKIERDLMPIVPRDQWTLFSHLLIFHGRQVCHARKPRCEVCPILAHCPAGPVLMKKGLSAGSGQRVSSRAPRRV